MDLVSILKYKYPEANFISDIVIQDDGDGPYIREFNIGGNKPSDDDLEMYKSQYLEHLVDLEKQKAKDSIISQLDLIDLKSIRALREGDSTRISELEDMAVKLREELKNI